VTLTTGKPTQPHAARRHGLAWAEDRRVEAEARVSRELRRISPWGTAKEATLNLTLATLIGIGVGLVIPVLAGWDAQASAYTQGTPRNPDFGAWCLTWGFVIGLAFGIVSATLTILDLNRRRRGLDGAWVRDR
jgi:hypothetical protein